MSSASAGFAAGFAEVDVTPPVGSMMAAFPLPPDRQARRARGVHDPIKTKALALSDGTTTVCLCATDVILWHTDDVARVRRLVAARGLGVRPEHVLLTATHTHSSGENAYWFGGAPGDAWPEALRRGTADAVERAVRDLAPASLSVAEVEAPFNHNRRVRGEGGRIQQGHEYRPGVTEGVTDPRLTLLHVRRDSGADVYWTHWAAHGVCVGYDNDLFSADYPGALAAALEANVPGGSFLFTNGAAGNLHPHWGLRPDFAASERVGRLLAEKVAEAAVSERPISAVPIELRSLTLRIPNRIDPSLAANPEVVSLALGPVVVAFWPGEPFVEFQLRLRQELPGRTALLVGYANGWVGYLPTADAAREGGYGVDPYPFDPPHYSRTMLPLEAGERLYGATVALLRGESGAPSTGSSAAGDGSPHATAHVGSV